MSQDKEYVVRGAKLRCAFGTHVRKLNLPQDHGVYTKNGLPMIHEEDCVAGKNIASFGICQRPGGEGDMITLEVPPEENHSNGPTYQPSISKAPKVLTGPACVPELLNTTWQEAYERVVIDDGGHKKTVTTESFLICKHFGGIITVLTSGQEGEQEAQEEKEENTPTLRDRILAAILGPFLEQGRFASLMISIDWLLSLKHYKENSKFSFDDYIYGQSADEIAKLLKMGVVLPGSDPSANACGWVATYNALRKQGIDVHPADIIRYYETHGGTFLEGGFGLNPLAIEDYLKQEQKRKTQQYYLPNDLDKKIKNSSVSILMYAHSSGAHYVTIEYKNGKYWIYNESNGDTNASDYSSIDEWAKDNNHTALSLITVD